MDWIELSIQVDNESVEPVAELFRRHAYGGIVIENGLKIDQDRDEYAIDPGAPVTVRMYLPQDAATTVGAKAQVSRGLSYLNMIRPMPPLTERALKEEDWQNAWKAYYPITPVGRRIVIKPAWLRYRRKPGQVVIEMDPGMAFGTGQHPTTRQCLEALEQTPLKGVQVLDVGAGSGILAIAAAKLSAGRVLAIDVDSVAVEAAKQNVRRSRMARRVRVERTSLPLSGALAEAYPPGAFQVVLANLTARIVASLAPELAHALAPDGVLYAAGIIDTGLADAMEALRAAGLAIADVRHDGDWRLVVARHGRQDVGSVLGMGLQAQPRG